MIKPHAGWVSKPQGIVWEIEGAAHILSCFTLLMMPLPRWGVYQYDPEEEHPRPEYLAQLETVDTRTVNFVTQTTEPRPPFWRMKVPRFLLSWTILAVLVIIACISVMSVILYRYTIIIIFRAYG